MSETVISQDETSAAATRNMTTAVVFAAVTKTQSSCDSLQLTIDAGRDEQRIDGDDDRGLGWREDAELAGRTR